MYSFYCMGLNFLFVLAERGFQFRLRFDSFWYGQRVYLHMYVQWNLSVYEAYSIMK